MLEIIENEVQTLIKILDNLKKSKFNKIRTQTLHAKSSYAEKLTQDIEEKLISHEEEIVDSRLKFLAKVTRETNYEIQQIIKLKLIENGIMANPPVQNVPVFDIKTATGLIQKYDGSATELDAFIDSVNLLAEITAAAHTATAIKFIKTRISGKARSALPANPQTFDEITDAIKQVCQDTETPDSIIAKLKATQHKGDKQKFCDEVETLSQKLSTLYINNNIPADVAKKMATKAGVEALINGVSNSELKIILKASEFETVQKAIQKINETKTEPTSQIFSMHSNNQRGQGRQNYNNFQNTNSNRYRPNNDYNRRENFSNNNYRRGNHRGNSNFRGNPRGNYHNNRRNNFNTRTGHSVFYTQSENGPVPQHIVVGGNQANPTIAHAHQLPQGQPNGHQCATTNRR